MSLPTSIFPQKLRKYLTARECVAFVGAGFSMPCGMPGWSSLLGTLVDEAESSVTTDDGLRILKDCRVAISQGRFPAAASSIKQLVSNEELRRCLHSAFDTSRLQQVDAKSRGQMLSRMEYLVQGPWAGIITTNFDTLIENAYDRFPRSSSPIRCLGPQGALGSVLCLPFGSGEFFVKLHGDMWADQLILSTEDYVKCWLESPRVRHFLTAVMLRYRLVFIGCSLEDEVLRLRRELWNAFQRSLPLAFALLSDDPTNLSRRQELKESAGIEPLIFSRGDKGEGFQIVDRFLEEARMCADLGKCETLDGTCAALKLRSVKKRLDAIGEKNRHLMALIYQQPLGQLERRLLFEPFFNNVPQGEGRHVLSTMSDSERLYRLLFLVSLDLISERNVNGAESFQIHENASGHFKEYILNDYRK